jgi:predicted DNA-binding antitoxin AbrB/MazE fold protein
MVDMETQHVQAVFEAGKLLPLQPLQLNEHERVELTVVRSEVSAPLADEEFASILVNDADESITLEQVQQALAKMPGSLVEDFARERNERF